MHPRCIYVWLALWGYACPHRRENGFPYIGFTDSSKTELNGHVLSSSSSQFANETVSYSEGIPTYFRYATASRSERFELASNSNGAKYRKTVVGNINYDAYGNLKTQSTSIFNGANTTPVHTTSLNNDYETPNTNEWLVGLVKQTSQTNKTTGLAAITNTSKFEYHPNNKGQLHKI